MEALQIARLDSPIHKLNPLTKLFIMLIYWLIALFTFDIPALMALCVFALLLYPVAKIPLRILRLTLSVMAGMFILFVVMNGFMFYGGETELFTVYKWPFTLEGLLFGISVSVKVLSVVLMIPLVTMTTLMPKLLAGLARLHLPYKFNFTLGLSMRLVPLVTKTYFDIQSSQRLRGHDISKMNYVKRLVKGYVPLFVPLVLALLRRSADMDIAIESRGFGAPVERTYLENISLTSLDYAAISVSIVFFTAIVVYLVYFGGITFSLFIQA